MGLINTGYLFELQQENQKLKKEVDRLEVEITSLQEQVSDLEEEISYLEKELRDRSLTGEAAEVYEGRKFIAGNELERLCFEAFIDCLESMRQTSLLSQLRTMKTGF